MYLLEVWKNILGIVECLDGNRHSHVWDGKPFKNSKYLTR